MYMPEGGAKNKEKQSSPNFEELTERLLFFLSGGSRKKSYEVSKLRGGGGGVLAQKMHFSSHYSNIMMESYCL